MLKKIISCVLIFAILTSFIVVSASTSDNKANNTAIEVVTGLGFVPEMQDYSKLVTRGELASISLRLYGEAYETEFVEGVDTPYKDVTAKHYKSADISRAYNLGIMTGFGDGYFYPDREVQLVHVLKIIMDMLGDDEYVKYNGGYPTGYINSAVMAGITKGVSLGYNDNVSYADLCQIIYNTLNTAMLIPKTYSPDSITFIDGKTRTFIEKHHNMYRGTGVVTDNGITRINGETKISKNHIAIDNKVYKVESDEFNSLLGYEVEFYYKESYGDVTIQYAFKRENNELSILGNEITSADNHKINYITNAEGRTKTLSLEQNGNVIYNGIYSSKIINYDFSKLVDFVGNVVLIDNDENGMFDSVFVTEYKNYIVEKTIPAYDMIVLRDAATPLIIDTNTFCTVQMDGKQISPFEIPEDIFVSVAMSENFLNGTGKKCLSIVASSTPIKGVVSEFSGDSVIITAQEGVNDVTNEYFVSKLFFADNNTTLKPMAEGLFYLDVMGEIGYYTNNDVQTMKYGYIIATGRTNGIDQTYKMKILRDDGEIEIFIVADKLKMDGERISSKLVEGKLINSSSTPGTISQLIRYKINKKRVITDIDTALPDVTYDSESLEKKEISEVGVTWMRATSTFKSGAIERYILADDTKVFVIPDGTDVNEEDYMVVSTSFFTNNETYGAKSAGQRLIMYNIEEAEPKVVEYHTKTAYAGLRGISQNNDPLAVVEGVSYALDNNGNECILLDIMRGNMHETLTVPFDGVRYLRLESGSTSVGTGFDIDNTTPLNIENIKFGDLILTYEDLNGLTKTILKLNDYNVSDVNSAGPISYGVYNQGSYLERMYASVRSVSGKKLLLDISNAEGNLYLNAVGSIQIYLVDKETKTVSIADVNDIIASADDNYADKVFIRTRANVIKQIVIYR